MVAPVNGDAVSTSDVRSGATGAIHADTHVPVTHVPDGCADNEVSCQETAFPVGSAVVDTVARSRSDVDDEESVTSLLIP